MTSGCFAFFPITVRVVTGSLLFFGIRASWAPLIRISFHEITGFFVRIGSMIDSPVEAMVWISAI